MDEDSNHRMKNSNICIATYMIKARHAARGRTTNELNQTA
jgi:hypothetical protein